LTRTVADATTGDARETRETKGGNSANFGRG